MHSKLLWLGLHLMVAAACAKTDTEHLSNRYTAEQFGLPDRPESAKGLSDDQFVALVDQDGQPRKAITTEETKLEVGDKAGEKSCSVSGNTGVYVTGRIGPLYVVDLINPCTASDRTQRIYQGYMPQKAVQIFAYDLDGKCAAAGSQAESAECKSYRLAGFGTRGGSGSQDASGQTGAGVAVKSPSTVESGGPVVSNVTPPCTATVEGLTTSTTSSLSFVPGACFRSAFINSGCTAPSLKIKSFSGNEAKIMLEKLSTGVPTNTQTSQIAPEPPKVETTISKVVSLAKFINGDGYAIPFNEFVTANAWQGSPVDIKISDPGNSNISCQIHIRLASPLVFDLFGTGKIETIPPYAGVSFAIDRSNTVKQTGWIRGAAAFLALDRNTNGKIDNAGELFGDHTWLEDGYAANGFLALRALDEDHNGLIEKVDPMYSRLLLWQDRNLDGISQAAELANLATYGITGIATDYSRSAADRAWQGMGAFANELRFIGRYFGPQRCGTKGCAIFDVYFSTLGGRGEI